MLRIKNENKKLKNNLSTSLEMTNGHDSRSLDSECLVGRGGKSEIGNDRKFLGDEEGRTAGIAEEEKHGNFFGEKFGNGCHREDRSDETPRKERGEFKREVKNKDGEFPGKRRG